MNSRERSKLRTRLDTAFTRSDLTGQCEDPATGPGLKKGIKSAGMTTKTTTLRPTTYSSGTGEAQKRRTTSLKPLCQRSQQRHELFRAEFEQKILLSQAQLDTQMTVKNRGKKPRSIVGGSLPPRLPSVRKTTRRTTPTATNSTVRKQVFPKPSPEALYRPRSVREQAAKERFLQQPGARPLNLTPPLGATFYDSGFDPISPTEYIRGGGSCGMEYKGTKNARSTWYTVHGTTPPAATDLDSEQITFQVDNKWRSPKPYNKHQNGLAMKQQYRLKSQQFQVQKMRNAHRTRNYDSSYEEVDSPLALYYRGEEDFEFA